MKKYDYLIVGAGLFGAVFAREKAAQGKKVLVIDKRPHVGGNVYTEEKEGINVHVYGAHIFHTNNDRVWEYVNRFARFNDFINSPIANFKGELYNLPFNMNTFEQMWGVKTAAEAEARIEEQKAEFLEELRGRYATESGDKTSAAVANEENPVSPGVSDEKKLSGGWTPRNLEEQAISLVGRDIFEKLVKGYTEKQWGRDCKNLPAFIIKRLPVRFTYDNNYFNAKYQGIPIGGYTKMVERMLGLGEELNPSAGEAGTSPCQGRQGEVPALQDGANPSAGAAGTSPCQGRQSDTDTAAGTVNSDFSGNSLPFQRGADNLDNSLPWQGEGDRQGRWRGSPDGTKSTGSLSTSPYQMRQGDVPAAQIDVALNTDYLEHKAELDELASNIVYTGPIDAYFGYLLGALEYRSLRFETELLDIPNFQGNAAVNYTDRETPWTRIIEHKWFELGKDRDGRDIPKTIITREFSSEFVSPAVVCGDKSGLDSPEVSAEGNKAASCEDNAAILSVKPKPTDPYYPVNDDKNTALYQKYRALADEENVRLSARGKSIIFGGRLAEYKYYDMDQVIAAALDAAENR